MLHYKFTRPRRARMPLIESRAYSQSRVAGRGLYIDFLEAGLLENPAVDDAVVCDPACETQLLEPGRAPQAPQPIKNNFLEPPLHRRCDRDMPLVDRLRRIARCAQPSCKE